MFSAIQEIMKEIWSSRGTTGVLVFETN